jgi:hypothetical protein
MGDIHSLKLCCATLLADICDNPFQFFRAPCAKNNFGTVSSEQLGGGFTDSTTGTRNVMTLFSTLNIIVSFY